MLPGGLHKIITPSRAEGSTIRHPPRSPEPESPQLWLGAATPSLVTHTKVVTLSTESIASTSQPHGGADARCASCGAPLAPDQRYCLECGVRCVPMSSVLQSEAPTGQEPKAAAPPVPSAPIAAGALPGGGAPQRNGTLTVIAGVGVLLLAMGVGVLIGRSGSSKPGAAPTQVITVAAPTSAGTATGSTGEASFTGSWPAGTSGYTVQLQTLPQSGTTVSAVEAAKSAASAKGAKAVGALKSEEFSSLSAGSYVIYSGVDHKKGEAEKALGALEKSFPGAKVISVSNAGSSTSTEPPTTSPGGVGESESKPAPPSVLDKLKGAKGKSYEEKSKNLPDVVETG
jgi:hypothetical protein